MERLAESVSRHYEKTSLFREASEEQELTPTRALQLGDELRRELAAMWVPMVAPSASATERTRMAELVAKWVPLLERPRFVSQLDNAPLIARFLRDIPAGHPALVATLAKAIRACAASRRLDPAVRAMLKLASRRETELGWSALIEVAFLALPESLADFERIMPSTVFSSAEVAIRHQRTLLALPFEARDARRAAFSAFYFQPASAFAEATLPELDEAPEDVWEGVALAALARPRLQTHFIAALRRRPRPWLREVAQLIASSGSLLSSVDASRWLEEHPTPSARSAGLPEPLPRTLPWSDEERRRIALFVREPVSDQARHRREEARTALLRLCSVNTHPASDLVIEALGLLAPHLAEATLEALFVEVCVITPQRSVLACATGHLLAHVRAHGPLAERHRDRLARRAPEVVTAFDAGLALSRLALPLATEGWLAAVAKLVPVTELPLDDFVFALAIARVDPGPLDALLAACTPNQRRLLVKRVPIHELGRDELRALVRSLTMNSPATLAVVCERLAEASPSADRLEILRELTDSRWHEGVRRAAIEALGDVGGRAELELLGGLRDLDTRSARTLIVNRLSEAGETLEAGALALSSEDGRLALASEGAAPPLPDPPDEALPTSAPSDRRFRLGPPPRRVPALVAATLLVFAPNVWSLFWAHGLAVAVVTGWPLGWRLLLLVGFFLNHVFADTGRALTLLGRGELLMASVRVHSSTSRGKHKTTTYHHTLTLLSDSGRADEHVIRSGDRLDEILDEQLEPVLATFSHEGRIVSVWPVDRLHLVEVSERGSWRLSRTAWALYAVSLVAWMLYLVL